MSLSEESRIDFYKEEKIVTDCFLYVFIFFEKLIVRFFKAPGFFMLMCKML